MPNLSSEEEEDQPMIARNLKPKQQLKQVGGEICVLAYLGTIR
jgi:hypothetical protein